MKMKNKGKLVIIALVTSAISAAAADNSSTQKYNSSTNNAGWQNSAQNKRMNKDCSVDKLLHAKAQSKDGQNLGSVDDLLMNPQTGQIEFAIIGEGGVLGIGEDKVPVPWRAITRQSDGTLVVSKDKAQLKSAPSIKKDYSNLDEPNYAVTVYEFYEIPVSAGASDSASSSSSGSGSSTNSWPSSTNSHPKASSP